jgi:hypothetical protein
MNKNMNYNYFKLTRDTCPFVQKRGENGTWPCYGISTHNDEDVEEVLHYILDAFKKNKNNLHNDSSWKPFLPESISVSWIQHLNNNSGIYIYIYINITEIYIFEKKKTNFIIIRDKTNVHFLKLIQIFSIIIEYNII